MSGGKPGFVLGSRPKKYKELPQQKRLREASEFCGIKKGMKRSELVEAMTKCLPEYFTAQKAKTEGQELLPLPD